MKHVASPDSSAWIHAHRSGLLPYVLDRHLVTYTAAVAAELDERFPAGREFWRLVRAGRVQPAPPVPAVVAAFGPGERSVLDVGVAQPGWLLLIDDRRPLEEAERRGLRALCTPVLAVSLYREGALDDRQTVRALTMLASLGTVSPRLLAAAASLLAAARQARARGTEESGTQGGR